MVDLKALADRLSGMVRQSKGRPFYFRDPVLEEMWFNINKADEIEREPVLMKDKNYKFPSCFKWMPKRHNIKSCLLHIKSEIDSLNNPVAKTLSAPVCDVLVPDAPLYRPISPELGKESPKIPRTNSGRLDWNKIRVNGAPFEERGSSEPSLYESDEEY